MTPELLALLTQSPPIVVVIIAGIYFLREMNKRDSVLMAEMGKRDIIWREFIKDISEGQVEMISEVVQSIKESADGNKMALKQLTDQVARNTATLLLHDATVRGTNPETIGTTEDLVKRILGR
jgi:hypothetical protein